MSVYVIVERWPRPEDAYVVREAETGASLFDTPEEAVKSESYKNCQNPLVVKLL